MKHGTAIGWTHLPGYPGGGHTWNPIGGCKKVSPGCANCYAVQMAHRLERMGVKSYKGLTVLHGNGIRDWSGKIKCWYDKLDVPLNRKLPSVYFVCSMADIANAPEDFLDEMFAVMALCPQHLFLVLTKHPERMLEYIKPRICLPNVFLGATVENQDMAEKRVHQLLQVPAAGRFISYEPALGELEIKQHLTKNLKDGTKLFSYREGYQTGIDWVIAGSESGPNARPYDLQWFRDLRDQCAEANVPFYLKQLTNERGRKIPLDQWPDDLKVQQFPEK